MKTTVSLIIEHEEPFPPGCDIDVAEIIDRAVSSGLIPVCVIKWSAAAKTGDDPARNL